MGSVTNTPRPPQGSRPQTPPQGRPGKRRRADRLEDPSVVRDPIGGTRTTGSPSPGACGSFRARSTTSRGLCAAPNDKSRIPLGTQLPAAYRQPASRVPPRGGSGSSDRAASGRDREPANRQRSLPPSRAHHRAVPGGLSTSFRDATPRCPRSSGNLARRGRRLANLHLRRGAERQRRVLPALRAPHRRRPSPGLDRGHPPETTRLVAADDHRHEVHLQGPPPGTSEIVPRDRAHWARTSSGRPTAHRNTGAATTTIPSRTTTPAQK